MASSAPRKMPTEHQSLQSRGRYERLAPLARGGMAEVWTARRTSEDGEASLVALKTIRSDLAGDDEMRRMFLAEASTVGRIKHVNVVEVIEIGEQAGAPFIAMTLIEGDSLAGLLRAQAASADGPALPWPIAALLCADVAAGLHAAHSLTGEQGRPLHVVHRDVSPQNVLVGLDGVARLVDFGVAKSLGPQLRDSTPGRLKGKVGYAAPEQICGGPIDHRVDIFALGVVLWESLTGLRLFRANDVAATVERVLTLPIPPLGELLPTLPRAVIEVVERALERDPARRFSSAATMHEALSLALRTSQVTHDDVARLVAARLGPLIALRRRALEQRIEVSELPAPLEETWSSATRPHGQQHPLARRARPSRRPSTGSVLSFVFLLLGAAMALWPFNDERPAALAPSTQPLSHASALTGSSAAHMAGRVAPLVTAAPEGEALAPMERASASSAPRIVSPLTAQSPGASSSLTTPDASAHAAPRREGGIDERNPYLP